MQPTGPNPQSAVKDNEPSVVPGNDCGCGGGDAGDGCVVGDNGHNNPRARGIHANLRQERVGKGLTMNVKREERREGEGGERKREKREERREKRKRERERERERE